jgi:trans-aconitate methyltransferase
VPEFDTRVPHIARIYDYWLDGKDNFAADRQAAEAAVAAAPGIKPGVRANRRFLGRAVRYMAEAGVRQYLDIGTGIPTADNTHQVAQSVAPDARIVYVDNDPIVLAHARALLTSDPEGVTDYIDADARDAEAILAGAGQTLDLSRPVGVMLMAILHCIPDEDDPYQLVQSLLDGVPGGSFLAISHPARKQEAVAGGGEEVLNRSYDQNVTLRSREQVSRFFDGLDLVEPGVVPVTQWRPDSPLDRDSPWLPIVGGVARKPLCPCVGCGGARYALAWVGAGPASRYALGRGASTVRALLSSASRARALLSSASPCTSPSRPVPAPAPSAPPVPVVPVGTRYRLFGLLQIHGVLACVSWLGLTGSGYGEGVSSGEP